MVVGAWYWSTVGPSSARTAPSIATSFQLLSSFSTAGRGRAFGRFKRLPCRKWLEPRPESFLDWRICSNSLHSGSVRIAHLRALLLALMQGYLTYKKTQPPTVGLCLGSEGGGRFLMGEVPLHRSFCWEQRLLLGDTAPLLLLLLYYSRPRVE